MRTALRFRRIPRTIAALAATAALLALAATAAGQASPGDIDRCVRDNLIKYAPPDRAVIDQYLSLAAACEASLNGEQGASIAVAPVGGDDGSGGGGSSGGSGDDPVSSDGTTTAPAGGGGDGGGSSPSAGGAERGAAPGGGDAVVLKVSADLPAADAGSPAAVSAVTQAPWWLLGIVLLIVAGVVSAIVTGARRRTR